MRAAVFVLGSVSAFLSFSAAAGEASPRAIFAKHGLFGTWAIDCTKPAGTGNPHAVYRPLLSEGVQRETFVLSSRPFDVSVAESVAELAQDELIITWSTREGRTTNRIHLQPDRMRIVDSTRQTGEKLSVNGRRVRDNAENPWFKRCNAAIGRLGQAEGP